MQTILGSHFSCGEGGAPVDVLPSKLEVGTFFKREVVEIVPLPPPPTVPWRRNHIVRRGMDKSSIKTRSWSPSIQAGVLFKI